MTTVDPHESVPARRERNGLHDGAGEIDGPSVLRDLSDRLKDAGDDSWSASSAGLLDQSSTGQVAVVGDVSDGWPSDLGVVEPSVEPVPETRRGPVVLKSTTPTPPVPPRPSAPLFVEPPVVEPPVDLAPVRSKSAPAAAPMLRSRRRPRVRKVTRTLRRIDPWTVFKVSVVMYAVLYLVLLIAGVLLWNLAKTTGTIDNVEGFVREILALKKFKLQGTQLFRASRMLGLLMVVAGTGFHVTLAIMFNLISDLVGGVRLTVLEEEVVLRDPKPRKTKAAKAATAPKPAARKPPPQPG